MKIDILVHNHNQVLLRPRLLSGLDYIDTNGYFVGYPYLGAIMIEPLYLR